MRTHLLFPTLVLSGALAFSQTTTPPTNEPQRDPTRTDAGALGQKDVLPAQPKDVPPDAAVITLKGVCPHADATSKPADCQTVVTRAEFERLQNAISPEMPAEGRERLGQTYARFLVIATAARNAGIEKLPDTQLLYEFAKLQVLAQQYGRKLQEEAANVPPGDIESYYREHQKDFEELDLQRVIVPRKNSGSDKAKPAPSEAEQKAMAEKMRARWLAGEDPSKLQAEAYKAASIDAPQPSVDIGPRRRSGLPMTQQAVFDLKQGDVSPVMVDPAAFFIYKVKKREIKPLDSVRDEVKKTLTGERLQRSMERVTSSVEPLLNREYFTPIAPPPAAKPADTPKAVPPATQPKPKAATSKKPAAAPKSPVKPK